MCQHKVQMQLSLPQLQRQFGLRRQGVAVSCLREEACSGEFHVRLFDDQSYAVSSRRGE
jgi:hypothetical protein